MHHRCPLCDGGSSRAFQAHGYWVRDCARCGHRFAELEAHPGHVSAIYGDAYFSGGGAGYPNYPSEGRNLRRAGRRYGELAAHYAGASGTVLDVGAAAGFILQGFRDAGWTGLGVEPNATMARFAREELSLEIFEGSLEELDTARRFDLVSLIQVIAHLHDPRAALEGLATVVKPGGLLLVETWRRDSLTARLFGRLWHEYSPPSVLHWFTRRGLIELAAGFGFEPVAQGRPAKWISAAHAAALIEFKLKGSSAGRLLARAVAGPRGLLLPYPAEDLMWVLFRRQSPLGFRIRCTEPVYRRRGTSRRMRRMADLETTCTG